jgi:Na+-driven multidrug efflux pump
LTLVPFDFRDKIGVWELVLMSTVEIYSVRTGRFLIMERSPNRRNEEERSESDPETCVSKPTLMASDSIKLSPISKPSEQDEHYRLGGETPLKTLLKLSIGPLFAQTVGSLVGIVDTIWVAKAVGEAGMAAVSTYSSFDGIARAFGFWIGTAVSTQISALFGSNEPEKASQVMIDMVRISVVFGLFVTAVLWPSLPPIVRWFGAPEDIVQLGMEFMVPLLICSFGTCLFICVGGCLQGEGRTFLFAVMNVCQFVINGVIVDPILLIGFKVGVRGASIATVVSELVPALVFLGLYFGGHFAVKPTIGQFFKKFSPLTLPALSGAASQLFANLSQLIPSIVIRKFIGDAAGSEFNDAMAGYNVMVRFLVCVSSVIIAFTMAYLPAASYSLAGNDIQGWLRLSWHCLWVTMVWAILTDG